MSGFGKSGSTFRRIHVCVGLMACIPWFLQGLTGALLVFEPELDAWVNSSLAYVEPLDSRVSLQTQFEAVQQKHPELSGTVYGIDLREIPGHATLMLAKPQGEVGPKEGYRIFVDPYRGEVLGVQSYRDSLMGKIYHFHRTFYLPGWGKWVTSTSALLLMFTVIVGLFVRRTPTDRATSLQSSHRRIGYWMAPLIFVIAMNGAIVTYRFVVIPLLFVVTGSEVPTRFSQQTKLDPPSHASRISLDDALEIAAVVVPNATNGVLLEPADPIHPITVVRRKLHEPRDVGGSFVEIDPYSGEVIGTMEMTDGSWGHWLTYFTINLHTGQWGGYFGEGPKLATRIMWVISALSVPLLVTIGVLSFLAKRKPYFESSLATEKMVSSE